MVVYCTCLHLAIDSRRSIQHQTFDLQELIGLIASHHSEAKSAVTFFQLRVDEGSLQLCWVSREKRFPSWRAQKEKCFMLGSDVHSTKSGENKLELRKSKVKSHTAPLLIISGVASNVMFLCVRTKKKYGSGSSDFIQLTIRSIIKFKTASVKKQAMKKLKIFN